MHAVAQATLYRVRETYWPIDGRNVVSHVIRQCVTCFRAKPRSFDYIMGSLQKIDCVQPVPSCILEWTIVDPFLSKRNVTETAKRKRFMCQFLSALRLKQFISSWSVI